MVCRGLQGCVKVCKDAWGQAMVCNGVRGLQGCARAYRGVQGHAKVCKGVGMWCKDGQPMAPRVGMCGMWGAGNGVGNRGCSLKDLGWRERDAGFGSGDVGCEV